MKRRVPYFGGAVRLGPMPTTKRHAPTSARGTATAAWQQLLERARRLTTEGRLTDALALLERAVEAAPEQLEPRHELAVTLHALGRFADALREYQEAARRFPDRSDVANNVAPLLVLLGHHTLAFETVQRALQLDPRNVLAMHNLGEILKFLGDWEGARDVYAAALAIDPEHPKAQMQYGMTLVALGEWGAGWTAMEARLEAIGRHVLFLETSSSPVWSGSTTLDGTHLLIQHEQGLGDCLMMVRFARELMALGAVVHLRCPEPLVQLLRHTTGIASCSAVGSPLPPHDLHIPLMSLPAALGVTPEQIDGSAYLAPEGECPPHIAALLPRDGTPTVALTWSGNPLHVNDHRRSMRGDVLAPLLRLSGVRFVAMQVAPAMEQVLPEELHDRVVDVGAHCRSFTESAHALQRVDLVVTVDTAVAHLAGAIGTPTLLCLPFYPDYRWQVSGSKSPWYNAVTILRQREASNWNGVVADVTARVQRLRDLC